MIFWSGFSSNEINGQIAYLTSNAVRISEVLHQRWEGLIQLITQWNRRYRDLNVILGPVFDHNRDTLANDLPTFRR